MSDQIYMSSRTNRENQHFFINNVEMVGVQSVEGDFNVNPQGMKFLGMANTTQFPRGATVGNLGISSLLISNDNYLSLTGDAGFNGFILKNTDSFEDNFSFASGYLTSYASRYSIGQIPTIEVSAIIFGDMGKSRVKTMPVLDSSPQIIKVPGQGCFDINIDDFQSNRLISYDINIGINRIPVYGLGSRLPINVYRSNPVDVSCSFQIQVSDYDYNRMLDYPYNKSVKDLTLAIRAFDTNETITSYSFNNLELVGQTYSAKIDDEVILNLQYKTSIAV